MVKTKRTSEKQNYLKIYFVVKDSIYKELLDGKEITTLIKPVLSSVAGKLAMSVLKSEKIYISLKRKAKLWE